MAGFRYTFYSSIFSVIFFGFLFYVGFNKIKKNSDQNNKKISVKLDNLENLENKLSNLERTLQEQEVIGKPGQSTIVKCQPWGELQQKVHDCVGKVSVFYTEFDWLQPFRTPRQKEGSGSGFFINQEGDFITNAHVVDQAYAIGIQIPSMGQEIFDAQVHGIAFDRDLALLKLTPESKERLKKEIKAIPYLKLGDSDVVRRADEVMALGYPLGQEYLKSTTGVVSGKELDKIQIDAPMNPGSSGGPVINIMGHVIGITCSGILSAQNVGYIIPVNELKLILKDLYKERFLRRPFLGLFSNPASEALTQYLGNPEPGGCYILDVYKGSPLHKAGINAGDMLYEINGYKVDLYGEMKVPWSEDRISVLDYAGRLKPGEKINMVIYRNGVRKIVSTTFDHMELPPVRLMHPGFDNVDYEILGGMVFMELTRNHVHLLVEHAPSFIKYQLIKYEDPKNQLEPAIVITHIFPGSQARRSRALMPGMILKEVNGQEVKTLKDLRTALKKKNKGFLAIKTSDKILTALKMSDVLIDEPRLSRDYRYPITALAQELINESKGGIISSLIRRN